jgi:hypothetical protein
MRLAPWIAAGIVVTAVGAFADLEGVFGGGLNHPAIEYATRPLRDPIAELNRKIQDGSVQLHFDGGQGYLRSVLDALHVPIESQMMIFSKTSVQAARINPQNPRSLFFNDAVTIGWVRGGFIEAAALDPQQGVHFYELPQSETEKPQFQRDDRCLSCHESLATLGVPGMLLRSVFTGPDGKALRRFGDFVSDQRSPLAERWGGWYVTGKLGRNRHLGNAMVTDRENPEAMVTAETLNVDSLRGKLDTVAYLSPYSDIAALMVFEHQMRMTNLITRVGWEVRYAVHEASPELRTLLRDTARELVDYLLFIDEAPIDGQIQGTSGFAEKFAAQGPLRQLDLEHRLMRYPCSYMIYSEAFESLPVEAKAAVYSRMWQILSGQENSARYARLSTADRKAILEILRKTKPGLPSYYRAM